MRQEARFQPRVDALEQRELLATGSGSGSLAVAEIARLPAPQIHASGVTQAVVQIKNLTSAPVTYSFRWSHSLLPSTETLAPGATTIYWASYVSGLKAEVRFDRSSMPGVQDKMVNLAYATYNGGGTPPASVAKTYAFRNVSGGIDLTDKVSSRAVVGFRNTSDSTVLLQFRWSGSASWSPTIKLAPGKVQYFWTSLLNPTAPQVRYDRSALPGWQLTTYGLAFNTFSGAGTPPFSSARVYTFRGLSEGVGLFS